MTSELVSPTTPARAEVGSGFTDAPLDGEVADVMTPGCVMISQAASVNDAAKAMAAHRVHAVLVVGVRNGTLLGWVTHRGMLSWLGRDRDIARVTEAITEQVRAIRPTPPYARRSMRSRSAARHACWCVVSPTSCLTVC